MAIARIGLIGTGWWATQFHLPSVVANEDALLVALADPNPVNLKAAGAAAGIERLHEDYRELLAAPDVDGVIIAVPHAFHYEIAKAALEAGKHVLLEKPLTLRSEDAWDLVRRAERGGLHLMAGYTYHFTPHARLAYDIVRSGRLGELRLVSGLFSSMVESFFRAAPDEYAGVFGYPITGPGADTYSDPAIAGGGQGQTQVTHPMGMVMWVTGQKATEVHARMENAGLAVDLVDAISYRLDGGAVGTMASIGSIRAGQPSQQELRYYGSEGILIQDLANGHLEAHFNDGTSETPPDLPEDDVYPAHAPARGLVDLILGRGENLAPGGPAAATVEFLQAAYQSAATASNVSLDPLT